MGHTSPYPYPRNPLRFALRAAQSHPKFFPVRSFDDPGRESGYGRHFYTLLACRPYPLFFLTGVPSPGPGQVLFLLDMVAERTRKLAFLVPAYQPFHLSRVKGCRLGVENLACYHPFKYFPAWSIRLLETKSRAFIKVPE